MRTRRNISIADRQSSSVYVIGYAPSMPLFMPGTTLLGISGTSLAELRTTGRTPLSLIYTSDLARIDGELTLVDKGVKVDVIIEDRLMKVPALPSTAARHNFITSRAEASEGTQRDRQVSGRTRIVETVFSE